MKLYLSIVAIGVFFIHESIEDQGNKRVGHKEANYGVKGVEPIYDFVLKETKDPEPAIKTNATNILGNTCFEIWPFKWYCDGETPLCCKHSATSTCCNKLPCCGPEGLCCSMEDYKCCLEGVIGCCPKDTECCEDEKCCPEGSECCDIPACCPKDVSECCDDPDGRPCCPTGFECAEEPTTCCPKLTPKSCSAGVCCLDEDCCGDNCGCNSGYSCCNDESCCDDSSSSCCPKGCNACQYPWSALPCTSNTIPQETTPSGNACPTPGLVSGSIYRILRKEETCDKGLLAQNTSGKSNVTPKQHLACINDTSVFPNSPYITFSSDPKSLEKLVGQFPTLKLTIAKVDQSKIPSGCTSIDLTTDANRAKYLTGDQRAMAFANDWCPILIECGKEPILCTVQPAHSIN